jgi:predicted MFS family arabinose efflux permease
MSSLNLSRRALFALMVAHCAGMVDLVALPVWVGALIAQRGLSPQQAGLMATLFLLGAVVASVGLAPRLRQVRARSVATLGFGVSALAFAAAATGPTLPLLGALHALAGVATGAALSVTHGSIARSARPHRSFALVGMALGVFAIVFLGATPPLVAAQGVAALFSVFAGVMAVAATVAAWAFPDTPPRADEATVAPAPLPAAVWFGIAGIAAMGLVQAMSFSFLERVGHERGFGLAAITGVLVALGVVNLFPAALAAALERRWPARAVMSAGPVLQALLAAVIMTATRFETWAVAASMFAAVMIFTHTFAFGALARLDGSGRALAATPAMLMTGAAIGPLLGGVLVQHAGYGSLAWAALGVGGVALLCFRQVRLPVSDGAAVRLQPEPGVLP